MCVRFVLMCILYLSNCINFSAAKDSWLINGLFDYYLSTNSARTAEVLAGVRDPHDKHLLDRLSDILSKPSSSKQSSKQKIQALTLLGLIARRQPTWLYKLASHALFRDLLKLLKVIHVFLTFLDIEGQIK